MPKDMVHDEYVGTSMKQKSKIYKPYKSYKYCKFYHTRNWLLVSFLKVVAKDGKWFNTPTPTPMYMRQ